MDISRDPSMSTEDEWTLRRIVVGLDGSPDSARAATYAAALAARTGASVIAVHAIGLLEHMANHGATIRQTMTRRWVDPFREREIPFEVRTMDGPPAEAVGALAESVAADLIVVGTRGAGNAVGVVGSTAANLVAIATVPVLVVPPPADRAP